MLSATGTLWTVGHSTRTWAEFDAMLRESGIAVLAERFGLAPASASLKEARP